MEWKIKIKCQDHLHFHVSARLQLLLSWLKSHDAHMVLFTMAPGCGCREKRQGEYVGLLNGRWDDGDVGQDSREHIITVLKWKETQGKLKI